MGLTSSPAVVKPPAAPVTVNQNKKKEVKQGSTFWKGFAITLFVTTGLLVLAMIVASLYATFWIRCLLGALTIASSSALFATSFTFAKYKDLEDSNKKLQSSVNQLGVDTITFGKRVEDLTKENAKMKTDYQARFENQAEQLKKVQSEKEALEAVLERNNQEIVEIKNIIKQIGTLYGDLNLTNASSVDALRKISGLLDNFVKMEVSLKAENTTLSDSLKKYQGLNATLTQEKNELKEALKQLKEQSKVQAQGNDQNEVSAGKVEQAAGNINNSADELVKALKHLKEKLK